VVVADVAVKHCSSRASSSSSRRASSSSWALGMNLDNPRNWLRMFSTPPAISGLVHLSVIVTEWEQSI
jgi:hypothetical protein